MVFPLKTSIELDSIEASIDLLEVILFIYDLFTQKGQKMTFLQVLSTFTEQIKHNISHLHSGRKPLSYWKGANSTARWIKEQWIEEESSFVRNLTAKRDSLLIHINYNLQIKYPQRTFLRVYPELSGLFLKRVNKERKTKAPPPPRGWKVNEELKKAFERIRKGWYGDP